MTGSMIAACMIVKAHYVRVQKAIEQLEADVLPEIFAATEKAPVERDTNAPTAVLMVNGFNGLGLATLTTVQRLFGEQFHNIVFVGVGEIDAVMHPKYAPLMNGQAILRWSLRGRNLFLAYLSQGQPANHHQHQGSQRNQPHDELDPRKQTIPSP